MLPSSCARAKKSPPGEAWSLKRLHRLILLSNTYQMQSLATQRGLQIDPQNRLLSHFPRYRLEGEAIRDTMLSCAGTLNLRLAGPPVVPPLNRQELSGLFGGKDNWPVTAAASEHDRRSVYLLERRTFAYPLFAAFDPPEVMTSCPQRPRTVVPAQALTLLNSPLARAQSSAFARRLLRECGNKPEEIVPRAWRLAFGRAPTPAETERARAFLQRGSPRAKESGAREARLSTLEAVLADLCLALFNANEFVYVD